MDIDPIRLVHAPRKKEKQTSSSEKKSVKKSKNISAYPPEKLSLPHLPQSQKTQALVDQRVFVKSNNGRQVGVIAETQIDNPDEVVVSYFYPVEIRFLENIKSVLKLQEPPPGDKGHILTQLEWNRHLILTTTDVVPRKNVKLVKTAAEEVLFGKMTDTMSNIWSGPYTMEAVTVAGTSDMVSLEQVLNKYPGVLFERCPAFVVRNKNNAYDAAVFSHFFSIEKWRWYAVCFNKDQVLDQHFLPACNVWLKNATVTRTLEKHAKIVTTKPPKPAAKHVPTTSQVLGVPVRDNESSGIVLAGLDEVLLPGGSSTTEALTETAKGVVNVVVLDLNCYYGVSKRTLIEGGAPMVMVRYAFPRKYTWDTYHEIDYDHQSDDIVRAIINSGKKHCLIGVLVELVSRGNITVRETLTLEEKEANEEGAKLLKEWKSIRQPKVDADKRSFATILKQDVAKNYIGMKLNLATAVEGGRDALQEVTVREVTYCIGKGFGRKFFAVKVQLSTDVDDEPTLLECVADYLFEQ